MEAIENDSLIKKPLIEVDEVYSEGSIDNEGHS
jgi:hypothetical protein